MKFYHSGSQTQILLFLKSLISRSRSANILVLHRQFYYINLCEVLITKRLLVSKNGANAISTGPGKHGYIQQSEKVGQGQGHQ